MEYIYSWPLSNAGLRALTPYMGKKFVYNLTPPNFANSLQLAKNLTNYLN